MARPAGQFTTIRTEGGLLPASLLERIARPGTTLPGLDTDSYHLAKGERFGEVINRSWLRLVGVWNGLKEALATTRPGDPATGLTRDRWLLILFSELGYGRLQPARNVEVDGIPYPISHEWGSVPIHLVGAGVRLDTRTAGVAGAARSSPHSLLQDLLNRSPERLWGIVSNGLELRVLRDSVALTRQAYVEFDLEAMMDGEVYADFTVLWLLAHQSRVEADNPEACWLERWSHEARTQGSRALEHLSEGVQAAVEKLGSGFLAHADNRTLRSRLESGDVRPIDLYRQLLRVVYRLLFVLVAEERDLLLLPNATAGARDVYRRYYSVARIRELAERRRGTRHTDLWEQIQVVARLLGSSDGCPSLGLPALGSFLFSPAAISALNDCRLGNDDLLAAMRALSGRSDERAGYRWRFDYRNLGAEELGSVYETLLDLTPEVNVPAARFTLTTGGAERRSTGSHYTPTPILKKVLDFSLEPLIREAMRAEDRRQALLDLRVLDGACGSGHFLIAVAHRIAEAVAEVDTGETSPPPEAVRAALRDVVARCLYGVDLNPMAVELCRVALWLETLDPGKPLSFLDHHIREGNSLLGVPLGATVARIRASVEARRKELAEQIAATESEAARLAALAPEAKEAYARLKALRKELAETVYDSWADAIPDVAFTPVAGDDRDRARIAVTANRKEHRTGQMALGYVLIDQVPDDYLDAYDALSHGAGDTVLEVTARAELYEGLQQRTDYQHLRLLADTWTAAWFWPLKADAPPPPTQSVFSTLRASPHALPPDVAQLIAEESARRRFFHFELEFPPVFRKERGGFDLILGNPPYLGGMKISTTYGDHVLAFLKGSAADVKTGGRVDLAAYFVRRCFDALRPGGDVCLITTNTIAEGDTREAALLPIVTAWEGEIANAVRSEPWEGQATVSVAIVHLHSGPWAHAKTLDGAQVSNIRSDLTEGVEGEPVELAENLALAPAAGTNILGEGFIITGDERERLLRDDPSNAEVVKAFIGGRQAAQAADPGTAQRWVIDFGGRTLDEASTYKEPMRIVETRVKPQREEVKRASYRQRWWRFAERSTRLYDRITSAGVALVTAIPEVSKAMMPVRLPADAVFQHKLVVFASDDFALFGELCSSFHWLWATRWCTTMRVDPNYNPVLFTTFARPRATADAEAVARGLETARAAVMHGRDAGVTDTYNLVTSPTCEDADVVALRHAHVTLDVTLAVAYGWDDLAPRMNHGVHPHPRFGMRWLPEPDVQREIENRLLLLNHQRARLGF